MYTRNEASLARRNFWTHFGQYMRPLPNAEGDWVNWLNYKTGVKYIYFRMDADPGQASISIELRHPDPTIRMQVFSMFTELKPLLHAITEDVWNWEPEVTDEDGRIISRISLTLQGVNVFDKADWPTVISFLKARLLGLDSFWTTVKHQFE